MSWRYGGVDVISTLLVSAAVLYVMRCFIGSQCSYLSSGAASARPPRWQTTRTRLFCARCSLTMIAAGTPFNVYRVVRKPDTQYNFWDNFGNLAPILTILSLLQAEIYGA